MTKQHIIDEIRQTAAANGGRALGFKAFERATGIGYHDWFGKYWKAWGDALIEAGLEPNVMQGPIDEDRLLHVYCLLIRELGRIPVKGDLLLKRRATTEFPSQKVFDRFGTKAALLERAAAYASQRDDFSDVHGVISSLPEPGRGAREQRPDGATGTGFVYLVKHGSRRQYKIGKTNNPLRREGELRIQLPEKVRPLHVIATDDPSGIEAYWHSRFASKRLEGEWFALSETDVRAFKCWKRIV